jgi:hypothetical protein
MEEIPEITPAEFEITPAEVEITPEGSQSLPEHPPKKFKKPGISRRPPTPAQKAQARGLLEKVQARVGEAQAPRPERVYEPPPIPEHQGRIEDPLEGYFGKLKHVYVPKSSPKEQVPQKSYTLPFSLAPTYSIEQKIAGMLQQPPRFEVEVSFGRFIGPKFIPFVPGAVMEMVKNLFSHHYSITQGSVTINRDPARFPQHSIVTLGNHSKRIVKVFEDPTQEVPSQVRRERKFRDNRSAVSNQVWGFRVYSSLEEPADFYEDEDPDFKPPWVVKTRDKLTWVFTTSVENTDGAFEVHLSEVTTYFSLEGTPAALPQIGYELEIERVSQASVNRGSTRVHTARVEELTEVVVFCLTMLNGGFEKFPSVKEKQDTTLRLKELVSVGRPTPTNISDPLKIPSGWWDKPVDLSRGALSNPAQEFAVGSKYDGLRRFIYFDINGVFSIYPPYDCFKLSSPLEDTLNGTLIDGEVFSDPANPQSFVVYAFDLLWLRRKDTRTLDFVTRLELLKELASYPFIIPKVFATEGGLYEKITSAFATPLPEGVKSDGLIFTPLGEYRRGRSYKWKPVDLESVDLFTYPATDHQLAKLRKKVEDGKVEPESEFANQELTLVQLFLLADPTQSGRKQDSFLLSKEGYAMVKNSLWIGRIVEFKGQKLVRGNRTVIHYTPYRVRHDKRHPNTVSHAAQMKRSILHPISEEVVKGVDSEIMTKCLVESNLNGLKTQLKELIEVQMQERLQHELKRHLEETLETEYVPKSKLPPLKPVRVLEYRAIPKSVHKLSKWTMEGREALVWTFVQADPVAHQQINDLLMNAMQASVHRGLKGTVVDELSSLNLSDDDKVDVFNISEPVSQLLIRAHSFDEFVDEIDETLKEWGQLRLVFHDSSLITATPGEVEIEDVGMASWPKSIVSFEGLAQTKIAIPSKFLIDQFAERGYTLEFEGDLASTGRCTIPPKYQSYYRSLKQLIFTRVKVTQEIKMTPQYITSLGLNQVPFGEVKLITLPGDHTIRLIGNVIDPGALPMAASLALIAQLRKWAPPQREGYLAKFREKLIKTIITPESVSEHLGSPTVEYQPYLNHIQNPFDAFDSNTDVWLIEAVLKVAVDLVLEDLTIKPSKTPGDKRVVVWRLGPLEYYPISIDAEKFVMTEPQVNELRGILLSSKYEPLPQRPEHKEPPPVKRRSGIAKPDRVFLLTYVQDRKKVIGGVFRTRKGAEESLNAVEEYKSVEISKQKLGA